MRKTALTGRVHEYSCTRLFFYPALVFLLVTTAAGCAARDFSQFRSGIESRGHYIPGVPFFRQSESTCGPAALASVLSFWGSPVDLQSITANIYIPKLGGTLPMDMERFARETGFTAVSSTGSPAALKGVVRKGVPVICLLDLGFGIYRQPHYVTVTGFDDVNAVIIAHDGVKPDAVFTDEAFQKSWKRAGNWMLVITHAETGGGYAQ